MPFQPSEKVATFAALSLNDRTRAFYKWVAEQPQGSSFVFSDNLNCALAQFAKTLVDSSEKVYAYAYSVWFHKGESTTHDDMYKADLQYGVHIHIFPPSVDLYSIDKFGLQSDSFDILRSKLKSFIQTLN